MNNLLNSILTLPRFFKQLIVAIIDIVLCIICVWLAYIIRLENLILFGKLNFNASLISIVLAIPIFWIFGLYRTIFRYTGLSIILDIFSAIIIYGTLYFLIIGIYQIDGIPRSIGVIQPMLLFFSIMCSRLAIKYIYISYLSKKNRLNKKNLLIYGAGEAGRQLAVALVNNLEFNVVGFLDDNEALHKQIVTGKIVYSISYLEKLIKKKDISFIFLAMPSINRRKRNEIINKLNPYKMIVKTLPSISEIVDGRIKISHIKDLDIYDLLGRSEVKANINLLNINIYSKTVLVTGAGGSIGSELCRQILKIKPKKLILLELNEFSLYKINDELKHLSNGVKIFPLLANVQDKVKLKLIFKIFKVDTVYHTAAYKHVPLVEENICEGIKNNVFGTLAVINASIENKISTLVLISSDKAVRPTNIMGASKRLSELCMQGICNSTKDIDTKFSIVRFGNVIESSGSVIPKFKNQIKAGGPVSLSHENVTRYFMTVSEAAQLVIQAGAMGKHSEVFVLDMGKEVKIKEVIIKMVALSGLTIKDANNPMGDIEIKLTGLKPGEKLYEELIIGDHPQKTEHPKIFKTNDPFIPNEQLKEYLFKLRRLISSNQSDEVKKYMQKILKSYQSNAKLVDHLSSEQVSFSKLEK